MSVPAKFLSWKEAVENECANSFVPFNELDPEKTLHDLIMWHIQVALDPKVSVPAQKLIEQGKNSIPKVPQGYALISLETLRSWGKLDEVEKMAVYPIY